MAIFEREVRERRVSTRPKPQHVLAEWRRRHHRRGRYLELRDQRGPERASRLEQVAQEYEEANREAAVEDPPPMASGWPPREELSAGLLGLTPPVSSEDSRTETLAPGTHVYMRG